MGHTFKKALLFCEVGRNRIVMVVLPLGMCTCGGRFWLQMCHSGEWEGLVSRAFSFFLLFCLSLKLLSVQSAQCGVPAWLAWHTLHSSEASHSVHRLQGRPLCPQVLPSFLLAAPEIGDEMSKRKDIVLWMENLNWWHLFNFCSWNSSNIECALRSVEKFFFLVFIGMGIPA